MSADQLDERDTALSPTDRTHDRAHDRAPDRATDAAVVRLETEVANLREALESRTQIGMAIGVLAVRYACTSSQAWAVLTRVSSHTNLKVREVARLVVAVVDDTVRPEDTEALGRIAPHLPTVTDVDGSEGPGLASS